MATKEKRELTSSWDLAGQSVQIVRSHFTPFMYLILLPGLLYLLGDLLLGDLVTDAGKLDFAAINPVGVAVIALSGLWMLVNLGPATHFELSAIKQKPKLISEYYKAGLKDSLRLFALQILTGLIILLGLLAFIVPGLIAIRMFILAPYYLVDKKLSIIDSLKLSARNTKPVSGYVWGVIGVEIAVILTAGFIGVIPVVGIVVGQLLTYGIAFLMALRYKTIEH